MNLRYAPKRFCVLMLVGLATVPLRADDFAGDLPLRTPVVAEPVRSPIPSRNGTPVGPACRCTATASPPGHGGFGGLSRGVPVFSTVPFGTSTRNLFGAQVANGHAARMVLYRYDFLPDQPALAPAGLRKLEQMGLLLDQTPFPLIVQPSGFGRPLDEARRRQVAQELADLSYPVPAERIIVAPPPSGGLSGIEAQILHSKFLESMGRPPTTGDPSGFAVPLPPN